MQAGFGLSAFCFLWRDDMGKKKTSTSDVSSYIENSEYAGNKYVLKCFAITMAIYTCAFVLDLLDIFVVDKKVMAGGYIPSLIIFLIVNITCRYISLSNLKTKYFILFSVILVYTIMGVSITYHLVLISILPFLYAMLYSSRKVMYNVYGLTVVSTFIIVYGGYYFGLCDANMALLTKTSLKNTMVDGVFTLTQVNPNPGFTLFLYYIVPRCLIYIAFMFVCTDIFNLVSGTLEKAKLTDALEKAKEDAENANNAKTQFLARMSHEIRTPINTVMGMNELIIRETKEEHTEKYAKDIKDSSAILLNIINEILDSSKIESGKMELVCGNYGIGSIFNDLYNMMSLRAKSKELELVFDINPDMPREYYGDDKRIRQILMNLLTNAIKYTEKGKVTFKVDCTVEGENAVIHCLVKDTGIGIREEDLGKIYDAFYRIDLERNKNIEGTGLGMNIVNQLLKLMGSELKIESEYEKGSEFSFDLVQKIVDEKPLGDFRGSLEKLEGAKSNATFTAPLANVLIVDDNKMNRMVFKGLIKKTKIQIEEAENGLECLEILKDKSFDVIFLDHMMPEMDGVETLENIREKKLCENVPIIMLTANAIVGDKEKYLSMGFDDFLSKPIIPEVLDGMLVKYLPKDKIINEE